MNKLYFYTRQTKTVKLSANLSTFKIDTLRVLATKRKDRFLTLSATAPDQLRRLKEPVILSSYQLYANLAIYARFQAITSQERLRPRPSQADSPLLRFEIKLPQITHDYGQMHNFANYAYSLSRAMMKRLSILLRER